MTETWVVKKDLRVNDPRTGVDRWLFAGQPIPPELVKQVPAAQRTKAAGE